MEPSHDVNRRVALMLRHLYQLLMVRNWPCVFSIPTLGLRFFHLKVLSYSTSSSRFNFYNMLAHALSNSSGLPSLGLLSWLILSSMCKSSDVPSDSSKGVHCLPLLTEHNHSHNLDGSRCISSSLAATNWCTWLADPVTGSSSDTAIRKWSSVTLSVAVKMSVPSHSSNVEMALFIAQELHEQPWKLTTMCTRTTLHTRCG